MSAVVQLELTRKGQGPAQRMEADVPRILDVFEYLSF